MQLSELLYKTKLQSVSGNTALDITAVCIDSRKITPGCVFIAVRGGVDGHQFIDNAVQNGAIAVVCETLPENRKEGVVYVQVESSAAAAGIIAHNFYGRPSEKLKLTGVTGTNGKTTIATLLYKLFSKLGYACGLISTVQNLVGNELLEATHTTPDPVSLNRLLAYMVEQGCAYAFMEVSSHAIHQHRVAGLEFAGAVFSNITHDHLDYHKTFDEYIRVKKPFLMPCRNRHLH